MKPSEIEVNSCIVTLMRTNKKRKKKPITGGE